RRRGCGRRRLIGKDKRIVARRGAPVRRRLGRVRGGVRGGGFSFSGGEPGFEIAEARLVVLPELLHVVAQRGDVVGALCERRGGHEGGAGDCRGRKSCVHVSSPISS